MSLINRMLDDLAARQAPGAETLSGVRLSDPMGEAQASLNARTCWVLLGIALVAAMLVWFVWPTRGQLPVPQPRLAVGEAGDAQVTASKGAASSAPPADATPLAATPFAPSLRMEAALSWPGSASSAKTSQAGTGRSGSLGNSLSMSDLPVQQAPVTRTVAPQAPVLRSETSMRAPDESASTRRSERRASRPAKPTAASPAPEAASGILAADSITPAAKSDASIARDALSRGDPAAALAILGPAEAARDSETASLRAAALQRLGRHGDAADAYRGLTHSDPSEPGHWVGLAISLEGQRKREEARIAYRRALQSSQLAPSLRAFAQTRVTALEAP